MHGYDKKLPGELNLASVEGDIDESHRLHDLAKDARNESAATAEPAQNNGPIRREAASSEVDIGGTSSCLS
ncbi:hypothetical protein MRX96_027859 [Rhipicephalus microplus]